MYKGLCVINMKGGVGKTSITVNLAWEAAAHGLKVLMVDLDPQASASIYLMGLDAYVSYLRDGGLTVFDIFEEHAPASVRDPKKPRPTPSNAITRANFRFYYPGTKGEKLMPWVYLIPSQLELATTIKNPAGKSHLLSEFLRRYASDYDLVVVDPPPTDSMATDAAYMASEHVLIPVRPERLSSVGFPAILQSVRVFREEYPHHNLDVLGLFMLRPTLSRWEHYYNETKKEAQEFTNEHGWRLLNSEISYSDSYVRGALQALPIVMTPRVRKKVKRQFQSFAREVFGHMGITY